MQSKGSPTKMRPTGATAHSRGSRASGRKRPRHPSPVALQKFGDGRGRAWATEEETLEFMDPGDAKQRGFLLQFDPFRGDRQIECAGKRHSRLDKPVDT